MNICSIYIMNLYLFMKVMFKMGKRIIVMKRNDFYFRECFLLFLILLILFIYLFILFVEIFVIFIFQSGDKLSLIKVNVRLYI